MRTCVVDTNVAISANGRNTHADPDCQRACVKELLEACRDRVIAIDDLGLIFDEYKQNLRFAGAPGVGDMFFKHVYNHQYNAMRVSRVSVTPCDNDNQGFEETPYHSEPSALGGAREGVVIRLARAFPAEEFHLNVCKSVREDHVQSDEHWSKHWRPCRIARG